MSQPYTHYLLIEGEPFNGHAQSVLLEDGTVAWSDGLTIEQYEEQRGVKLRKVTTDEFAKLEEEYLASLVQLPREVTKQKWWDALEVLPPCRWHTHRGVELFHISERYTGDIVTWGARLGERYFLFYDRSWADSGHLAAKVASAVEQAPR